MKGIKKLLAWGMAAAVLVSGVQMPTSTVKAETAGKESKIATVKFDVTVTGKSESETSFTWNMASANWSSRPAIVVTLDQGNGDYSFEQTFAETSGLINLGYLSESEIENSEMAVTINKITVNGYEMTYETAPTVYPVEAKGNGISNIWGQYADGAVICSGEDAYLAFYEGAEDTEESCDDLIKLYVTNGDVIGDDEDEEVIIPSSKSIDYVKAMGSGWNLGNSFEGYDSDLSKEDLLETTWGNPVVAKELIQAVKAKGYKSIRMPFTIYRRYTVKENPGEGEYKYVINEEWLKRYKEVVDWAVEEGMYVMINIHCDSVSWLNDWDGSTDSEEYRMYTDFWKQLADYMSDEPEQVCFEAINEPEYTDTTDENGNVTITAQDKLDTINKAAYDIIRDTEGNETRMIVMQTMVARWGAEYCKPVKELIESLNDENVIASIHYYSEWVYSANLGKTSFDEELWKVNGESYTARGSVDDVMNTTYKQFTKNGIGVIFGEYGLLGYDASEGCLQTGEELKYYEYVNEKAREYNVCLIFWDNGSGINRNDTVNYSWKKPEVGAMLEASMEGRSSYSTGLNTLYFTAEATADVQIPLTLNGNTFVGIEGLTAGTDYTYDSATATVTISKDYINKKYNEATAYGTIATLVMKFSSGADWNQYLVRCATPYVAGTVTGNTSEGIKVQVQFNGKTVKRVCVYQNDIKVGPHSGWWPWLQYDGAFGVDYENGTLDLLQDFFIGTTNPDDINVADGAFKIQVEYFDGQTQNITLNLNGDTAAFISVDNNGTLTTDFGTGNGSNTGNGSDTGTGSDTENGTDAGNDSDTGTDTENDSDETETNIVFTSGKYKYQVTGTSTVAFAGVKSKSTTTVTIPKTVKYQTKTYKVTSVAAKALYKNTKVTKVTIGANVKTVGADAFTGCTKLKKISVKNGVSFTIGAYKYKTTGSNTLAFSGIKSAKTTKVTVADKVKIGAKSYKVTSIASKALYQKTKVTKVTIGANVTKIGSKAFYGCKKLSDVKVNTKKLKSVGSNAFKGTKASLKITVPSSKYGSYKNLFKKAGLGSKAKVVKK